MADCLFCKIASKELEADIVHESSDVIAFRDINPAAPTHVLVIPKVHLANATELSADQKDLLQSLFGAIASVVHQEGIGHGYRLVTNTGADAGQSVDHLHFHVLGGRSMSWPPG